MTPEEFQEHLRIQNEKYGQVQGSPDYAAKKVVESLADDFPAAITAAEEVTSLCQGRTHGVVAFGERHLALYLQLRELHFSLIPYEEITSLEWGKTPILRNKYLQINRRDGKKKRIPALHSPVILETVHEKLEMRI